MRDKIILPNSFLEIAEEELRAGRSIRLLADGTSMYPFIRGGKDEVEIVPVKKDTEPEMFSCYLCKWQDRYIIHRLIGKEGKDYIFQGDGNPASRIEKVNRENIIGLLIRIYSPGGDISDCRNPKWVRKGKIWFQLRKVRRIINAILRRSRLR